jgi:Domain of unknown function (DUF4272)
MKSAKEIATRAIILLCLSDRCALERTTIGGRVYTIKQRDEQREVIYQWLQDKGYTSSITLNEKILFEREVGIGNTVEILSKQSQYEVIEPCLWSLGLVDKLSDYDKFVLEDFHPLLQIGGTHSLEKLLNTCSVRMHEDIVLQNEISMLWHWRARESNNSIFKFKSAKEIIISTFGKQYMQVIDRMGTFKTGQDDFIVNNKVFNELSSEEKNRIKIIAQWRHHAYEWIIGDKTWDDVELNT